jgi:predicted enzyme related to lactoylglutathione lyase
MATRKTKTTARKKTGGKRAKAPIKAPARKTATRSKASRQSAADVPQFFRLNVEVGNLDQADQFYSQLLATTGKRDRGARVYFTAGPVTLQVVDVTASGAPHPAAKALYFTVKDLDAIHRRAISIGALSKESIHGAPGGDIVTRPWGERSFYAEDPWGNPLCFVEAGTVYAG